MTALAPRTRPSLARRLAGSPWVWAAACFAVAIPWYLTGAGLELVPFLLTLVGGWLCGIAFVGTTLRMSPTRRGLIVHAVGAVLAGAALTAMVLADRTVAARLSGLPQSAYVLVQMASIPAVGWTWLALISRASGALRRPTQRAVLKPPVWEHDRDGSLVRFAAVPLRMRALAAMIVGMAVVIGTLVSVALIATGDLAERIGPLLVIALIGLVVALPVYLIFLAVVRRRTAACTVRFGDDGVRVEIATERHDIPWRKVDLLRWRCDSDYARIELRGAGTDISLIAGMTRPRNSVAPILPALPQRVLGAASNAGLDEERSHRHAMTTFRRAS